MAGGIDSDVPVILAADDLAPSETVQLDKSKILGFVTQGGSGNSHTAILARTMGIPAVIGTGDALREDYEGKTARWTSVRTSRRITSSWHTKKIRQWVCARFVSV